MWWCQFIDWSQFVTDTSFLCNFGIDFECVMMQRERMNKVANKQMNDQSTKFLVVVAVLFKHTNLPYFYLLHHPNKPLHSFLQPINQIPSAKQPLSTVVQPARRVHKVTERYTNTIERK